MGHGPVDELNAQPSPISLVSPVRRSGSAGSACCGKDAGNASVTSSLAVPSGLPLGPDSDRRKINPIAWLQYPFVQRPITLAGGQ
jgi:hypothetical protein